MTNSSTAAEPPVAPPPATQSAPTPTSTVPSRADNCASLPSACGFPDATNTGVSDDATLPTVGVDVSSGDGWHLDPRGWVTVDSAGATLENLNIPYNVDVIADDVTIRNIRIVLAGETFGISVRHADNVTISDSQISGPDRASGRLLVAIKDIYGDSAGLTVSRVDISGAGTGIQFDNGIIEDSFIHDVGFIDGDHINGITSNGGAGPLVIRHNTILNDQSQTDAIGLFQDFSPQSNKTITDNLMAGGAYTVYAGANVGLEASATNIVVTGNRIARTYFDKGGAFGPVTAFADAGGNVWEDNVWDDSGEIIPKP